MSENCFITFPSTYHVLQAEKMLLSEGLPFTIVPIPREITSSCGMAIMIDCSGENRVKSALVQHKTAYESFHRLQNKQASLWQRLTK